MASSHYFHIAPPHPPPFSSTVLDFPELSSPIVTDSSTCQIPFAGNPPLSFHSPPLPFCFNIRVLLRLPGFRRCEFSHFPLLFPPPDIPPPPYFLFFFFFFPRAFVLPQAVSTKTMKSRTPPLFSRFYLVPFVSHHPILFFPLKQRSSVSLLWRYLSSRLSMLAKNTVRTVGHVGCISALKCIYLLNWSFSPVFLPLPLRT